MRTFIACDMHHEGINDVMEEIRKCGADIKFVEPRNTHITLRFLGEIDEEMAAKVGEALKRIDSRLFPFEARLRRVGVFPNPRYMKVVWIGLECPELGTLKKELDEALKGLGFKGDRDFKPHLTIGRVRSAKNKERLLGVLERLKDIEIGVVTVDSVRLKMSRLTPNGPVYTDLLVVGR